MPKQVGMLKGHPITEFLGSSLALSLTILLCQEVVSEEFLV